MVPKRTAILKKISKAAKVAGLTGELAREGGSHSVYSLDGLTIPVGRPSEFDPLYAETLYRECQVKLGKGWWR